MNIATAFSDKMNFVCSYWSDNLSAPWTPDNKLTINLLSGYSFQLSPIYHSFLPYLDVFPIFKQIFFMHRLSYLSFLIVLFCACNTPDSHTASFVDVRGIDSSIKPGDNFFRYVNGHWYDTAKIADDQSGVGSYSFLNIPQKRLLQNILDSVSRTTNAPGSIDQKVGDFYASGMDTATINQRGYAPIQPILGRIDAIGDLPSLIKFAANELKTGNHSIIAFGISPDNKNSGINIAHVYQTGIGLPDRDYYFKTDSPTLRIQQAYQKYLGALFQLTGSDPAAATKNADLVYGTT
jgi:putative endopeptidase